MTREEERLEQAKFYNDKGVKDPHIHFLRGAEWADSTMLDNASELLTIYLTCYVKEFVYGISPAKLVNKFRQTLKGL